MWRSSKRLHLTAAYGGRFPVRGARDAEPLAFWDRYGRGTVERLKLRPGAHVLDVCCGSGASALHNRVGTNVIYAVAQRAHGAA